MNHKGTTEVEDQRKIKPTILEELQQENIEMDEFFTTSTEANVYVFILEKSLQKEYVEPFSAATIVFCAKNMKTYELLLRSITVGANTTTYLSPYVEQGQTPYQDKGKSPILNHLPNPTDTINYII